MVVVLPQVRLYHEVRPFLLLNVVKDTALGALILKAIVRCVVHLFQGHWWLGTVPLVAYESVEG